MILKKVAGLLAAAIMIPAIALSSIPAAWASEASGTSGTNTDAAQNPYVRVQADYADDITPAEGDVFILTYSVYGGMETAQIEVDASIVASDTGLLEMDAATYQIKDIVYKGTNTNITEQGFGVSSLFEASASGNGLILIAVGAAPCASLEQTYDETIIKDSNHDAYGRLIEAGLQDEGATGTASAGAAGNTSSNTAAGNDAAGASGSNNSNTESVGASGNAETDPALSESSSDSSNASAQSVDENDEDDIEAPGQTDFSRLAKRGIPLCGLFVATMLVIFILHKKKFI